MKDYHSILMDFYSAHGLLAKDFRCKNSNQCEIAASPRELSRGASAHIGEKYGDPYRIVVVSLDRGHQSEKTDSTESRTNIIEGLWEQKTKQHMTGTKKILTALLEKEFASSENLFLHFAMTNSAKCSGNDGDRSVVPDALYEKCATFAWEELGLLEPELIITQGKMARNVLNGYVEALSEEDVMEVLTYLHVENMAVAQTVKNCVSTFIGRVQMGREAPLLLSLPHPSARGGQWQQFERSFMDLVVEILRFLLKR